jgi:hypothetical protein
MLKNSGKLSLEKVRSGTFNPKNVPLLKVNAGRRY